jgi:hypothetical protein
MARSSERTYQRRRAGDLAGPDSDLRTLAGAGEAA